MSEQFWITVGVVATALGPVYGAWKARDASRLNAALDQVNFLRAELSGSRAREQEGYVREKGLRDELKVYMDNYGRARDTRMVRYEKSDSVLVHADGNGRILNCSENVSELLGWPAANVIGGPVTMLMPKRYRDDHDKWLTAASGSNKDVVRGEIAKESKLVMLHRDGTEIPVTIAIIGGGPGQAARYTATIRRRNEHDSNF